MQIEPIFVNFLAVDNILLSNKIELIEWSKQKIQIDNNGTNSSYFLDSTHDVLKELVNEIEDRFNHLHNINGLNNDYKQVINNFWVNDGSKNVDIEAPHRHTEGVFSAVYWPVADENAAPLTFINPNNQLAYVIPSWLIDKQNEFNSDRLHFPPQEDTVIFFPSWLWHYVSNDKTASSRRMSFAFNSKVIKND